MTFDCQPRLPSKREKSSPLYNGKISLILPFRNGTCKDIARHDHVLWLERRFLVACVDPRPPSPPG
ncbi:hypothetical protein EYF80_047602 [Liparis tanakae]|uniref:Uncharacterized protein n=1 Tax=Liparis tanakae TaxID=230148 RepID=A0A4Z2FLW5_9TELE|nr:hypothetical protein EYF80_047602 [Liparis tanakae]